MNENLIGTGNVNVIALMLSQSMYLPRSTEGNVDAQLGGVCDLGENLGYTRRDFDMNVKQRQA